MITHEQDPDVVRWGLQLFESDPYSNCGYCDTSTQDDADYYTGQYLEEDQYDLQSYNVESDELIAHALQAQLAISDLPQSSHEGEEHSEACAFQQDWLEQSIGSYTSGQEGQEEEIDEMEPPSSCSSPPEMAYSGEEWSYPLELADEYAFDGEVEKWLNQMVPVPHVPRINGEIPSIDEATLDHQRLLDRLQVYDLVERKVDGDGNCQFRALSDQFYRTAEHHEFVRQQVVNQLKSYPEIYEGYVPMAYGDYLEKMSKNGEWGDHVTLRAAADSYGVKIFVITSFKDTCYIEILPNVQRSKRVILLSFWAEVHYNPIYPQGDLPAFGTKRKKKWRMLQNVHLESPDEYQ
ncbi:OTU domain-containing protein [Tripterygium wilfordii]|uniref:ubiquitinyl hydrolase 1 n=1 Tax=Tripterygium wilfordii TaxID=458696 RepID=A0A7J7DEE5_TRIWF|nr:OVARIAN TUMOR DOMAIN-containing deubiquitinating enzyme 12-like [Tripterygium wilfordii]XP_038706812.1 OVARIAN TUMOR DOMAIN-containing deubiquitinating enzyme 12-like [Tripterygium wilfordii]XP_038706813.1 OVARIAN TUMOR DOMAIN-containing deubiquitinating enzyme 12-like [Tripterygium wilfordii]XP_038706814.1 OVARIAN TUMOR DOMAIN-containing deubiquitinating enzyme 12-like [Tripterygium wilfordii]XP_038706815.1 OVARIAN TUMOR DOMAIN-containing deubiquitinating enzyme 12-like [Tripterygium wilfor